MNRWHHQTFFLLVIGEFFFFIGPHAVLPSVPAGPFISDITSSQARVSWTLTNQTLDEGPNRLTLTVNYTNNLQLHQYLLSAGTVEMLVQSIDPGMEYLVTVSASNQDGTRTTDPVSFRTLPARKHLQFKFMCVGIEGINGHWMTVNYRLVSIQQACCITHNAGVMHRKSTSFNEQHCSLHDHVM